VAAKGLQTLIDFIDFGDFQEGISF